MPKLTKSVAALAGVATVVLALTCGSANATVKVKATAGQLNWQSCTEQIEAGLQCATLQVPLDYTHPNRQQIGIAVIRHAATDTAHRTGTLFWNPGGPGGAGTQSLGPLLNDFTAYEQAHFDIVSFDPRGIGESDQLQCYSSAAAEAAALANVPPALTPSSPAEEKAEIAAWAAFDMSCAQNGGPIQYHMGTADVARDMDRIRAAIGDAQISYDGTSYGTYLGVTYANLFPSRVAHMVLDGNVDAVAWNDAGAGATTSTFDRLYSPLGSEIGFQIFIQECASAGAPACAFAAGSYKATLTKWQSLRAQLRAKPVTVGGVQVNGAYLETLTFSSLESVQPVAAVGFIGWSGLAQELQSVWTAAQPGSGAAKHGQLRPMPNAPKLAAADYPEQVTEGTDGVLCGESPDPTDPYSYRGQADRANASQSPDGAGNVWTYNALPCAQWQARATNVYRGPWTNLPASKYLVIGTIGDSNTAYTDSVRIADEVGGARLLTETGGGHTSLLNQSTCVNNRVDAFLATGALPPAGTVCNQDRAPF